MAKLALATNFDDTLLNDISRLNARFASTGNKITEVFGSLPSTFGFGSGRPVSELPAVSFKQLEKHVRLAHCFGLAFNYVLNQVCLGGMEYESAGIRKISKFIERLAEIKIDVITVSKPFLAQFIHKNYPDFLINASAVCGIDSLQKAKEWIDLGAHRLTLKDSNRNFNFIKLLKRTKKIDVELIVNSACRSGSSLCHFHYLELAHSTNLPFRVHSMLNCKLARLKDPVDYLFKHGTWIRPEDLDKYDRVGVDIYKIVDRICTTKELLVRAKAYLSQSYKGNLLSIIGKRSFEFAYLDNQKLDGFIDHFLKKECPKECNNCDYCNRIAGHALKVVNKKKMRKAISEHEKAINLYFKTT